MVTPPDRSVAFSQVGEPASGAEQLSAITFASAGGWTELIVKVEEK